MDIFIKRLQMLLDENNMNQKELAHKVGVTEVTISRYMNGERKPRVEIINKIAEALNTTTDYLLGRSDIRNPYKKTSINKIIKSNDVIEKEYKKEIEFLEKFRQEMISRGYDYYKDKTLEELADIVVKHLKIQEILDDNNSKSN